VASAPVSHLADQTNHYPPQNSTWDATPLMALVYDADVTATVVSRSPALLAVEAVHEELRMIAGSGDEAKPCAEALQALEHEGLLAPPVRLSGDQHRRAESVRDEIFKRCGPGPSRHWGESNAIVHAKDDDLLFVTSDKTARDVARDHGVGTACVADLLSELVELNIMTAADAVDLCADLAAARLYPGRPVTGPTDLYTAYAPLVMTDREWQQP
jgi:hypothetical protein